MTQEKTLLSKVLEWSSEISDKNMPINDFPWDAQYQNASPMASPRSYGGRVTARDQAVIDRFRMLADIAIQLVREGRSYGGHGVETTIQALATIDLQNDITELRHTMLELRDITASKPGHVIHKTERVVVGDPINAAMSEVYKP